MNAKQLAKLKSLYEEMEGKKGNTYKIKNGLSQWRFIPYKSDPEGDPVFFFKYTQHYMGQKGGYLTCGASLHGECWLCDWRAKSATSDKYNIAALAWKVYPGARYMVNALEVSLDEEKNKFICSKDPVELPVPKRVYDHIFASILRMGQTNILDVDEGNIIGIERKQLSLDRQHVEYTCLINPQPLPIFKNLELREKVFAKAVNFEETIQASSEEDCNLALHVARKDPDFMAEAVSGYTRWIEKKEKK